MPFVPKKIGRTKGYVLVTIGLVFGLLQALLTIPLGGGLCYFVMIGAILGALGFMMVAFRNKFSQKVKTGAIISAVILIVAVVLSFIQLSVMSQMEQDIQDVGDATDDVNSWNWEEKQDEVAGYMRNFVTNFLLFVVLLATATALMAIAVAIPPLRGKQKKKLLMLIPLVIAVLAIVAASLMTYFALGDLRGITDDFEAAETQGDFEDVADEVEEMDILAMIQGSRIGGILNFIAILMAIILSFVVKVGIEDPNAPGEPMAPGYAPAPGIAPGPGYAPAPRYAAAPPQQPPRQETRSFNCPHCRKIFSAQQTNQVQQVSCPSCRGMVTINPLQPKAPAPRPSPPLPQPPTKLPPRQIKQPVRQPPRQQPQQPAQQPAEQPPQEKPEPQQPAQEPPAQQPAQEEPAQTQPAQPAKEPETKEESLIDILKKRLAKGEIDLETYREMKKELE